MVGETILLLDLDAFRSPCPYLGIVVLLSFVSAEFRRLARGCEPRCRLSERSHERSFQLF